jgi:hypothetical protein
LQRLGVVQERSETSSSGSAAAAARLPCAGDNSRGVEVLFRSGAANEAREPPWEAGTWINRNYGMPFEAGGLIALLRGFGGAQVNDAGWPRFDYKCVTYPQFEKEW